MIGVCRSMFGKVVVRMGGMRLVVAVAKMVGF